MLGSSLVSTETAQPYSGSTQVESTSRQSGSIWEDQFLGGQGAVLIDRRTGKALWSTAKDDSGGWADTISQLGGGVAPGGAVMVGSRVVKQLKKDWEKAARK